MSTPTEHYREAERLLASAEEAASDALLQGVSNERSLRIHQTIASRIAMAQVHATLATAPHNDHRDIPRHAVPVAEIGARP